MNYDSRQEGVEAQLYQQIGQLTMELGALSDDLKMLLYRDVREPLTNVIKHAEASKVEVSISKVDQNICIVVEDDGVGFDSAETMSRLVEGKTFGLFSVMQRLEQIGGHIEIESALGHGCKATITAPIK